MWISRFPTEAGRRFGPFTEQNIGKELGIVLEHQLQTAPVINGRIDDTGVIEGQFGEQEANDLGLVLRSGALPASIKYLEERTVGPSLGADSIRHGVQASIVSLLVVMVFMVVYYRLSGVNAVVALILNLVILLAALAYFGAVLTLAGHRRRDFDDRHGRGFERPDFRAHPGRIARLEGASFRRGHWDSSAPF